MEKRVCNICGAEKPLTEEFFSLRSDTGRFRGSCRDCLNKENLERYHRNPKARRKTWFRYYLKKYGLTEESFHKMYESQKGVCAICSRPILLPAKGHSISESACIDHCHNTGHVRGLLCRACNTGIGQFNDNPETIKLAIKYLERFV